jgi:hypothetical protein
MNWRYGRTVTSPSGGFARLATLALGALLLTLAPVAARAQGAGRSMDFDTSIRSSGMGGASAGVAWGDPNAWGNVASLSRVSGMRWEYSRTQLVPGLATDVWLRTNRMMFGGGGIGVSVLGAPGGTDGVRLDYGISEETDLNGHLQGTFASFETVNGAAIGVSLPGLLSALSPANGALAQISDAFDLSLGISTKRTHIELAPMSLSGVATATTYDLGVQARVSPLFIAAAPSQGGAPALRDLLLLDLGVGYSELNAMGGTFTFLADDASSPATRMHRVGTALRAGLHMPRQTAEDPLAALLAGLDPLVAVSVAYDHDDGGPHYKVNHTGYEITIANVYTFRHGQWTDRGGEIDGQTTGWGLGVPLGPWAGFRYDKSTVPQASGSGLPDVTRKGWTAWFDMVRVWQDLRIGTGSGAR